MVCAVTTDGDSTHHCRSPAPTLNGYDLIPSRGTRQHHASASPPKTFHEERDHTFPRSTKHVYTSLACSQEFSKICWRVEICSVVIRPRRKQHWVSSSFGSKFSRHLGMPSSWKAKRRDDTVVGSFTPVSHVVYGDD